MENELSFSSRRLAVLVCSHVKWVGGALRIYRLVTGMDTSAED